MVTAEYSPCGSFLLQESDRRRCSTRTTRAQPHVNDAFSPEFIALLKQGEPLAWREGFSTLWPIAWRGTGSGGITLPSSDREEVAAEALAEVAQQISDVDTGEQLTALTFVIARRRAVSRLRAILAQKRTGQRTAVSLDELREMEDTVASPDAAANLSELALKLDERIRALGEPAASIIADFFQHGHSYREIAERYRVTRKP